MPLVPEAALLEFEAVAEELVEQFVRDAAHVYECHRRAAIAGRPEDCDGADRHRLTFDELVERLALVIDTQAAVARHVSGGRFEAHQVNLPTWFARLPALRRNYEMYVGVQQSEAEHVMAGWRNWAARLTSREQRLIEDYQGIAHYLPFLHARLPDDQIAPAVLAEIRALDEALGKAALERDIVVWRGRRASRDEPGVNEDAGARLVLPGFSSCSLIERVALSNTWVGTAVDLDDAAADSTSPLLFEILLPRGATAAYVQGLQRTDRAEVAVSPEAEVLLPRNLEVQVLATRYTEETRSEGAWGYLDDPTRRRPVKRIQVVPVAQLPRHQRRLRAPQLPI